MPTVNQPVIVQQPYIANGQQPFTYNARYPATYPANGQQPSTYPFLYSAPYPYFQPFGGFSGFSPNLNLK